MCVCACMHACPASPANSCLPRTCECDLIWKYGLCTCNQVKIKSYWVRVDPNSMTGILIRGRQTQREDAHMKMEAEIGVMLPQTKE